MTEEKQIDEMARIISEYDECGNCKVCIYHNCCSSEYHATNLYNAGYRKQAEGEWVKDEKVCSSPFCSLCGAIGGEGNYCHYCGAKMSGGAK